VLRQLFTAAARQLRLAPSAGSRSAPADGITVDVAETFGVLNLAAAIIRATMQTGNATERWTIGVTTFPIRRSAMSPAARHGSGTEAEPEYDLARVH